MHEHLYQITSCGHKMNISQVTDNLAFTFSLSIRMSYHKTFLRCILTSDPLYVHVDFHLQKEKLISILIYSIIV